MPEAKARTFGLRLQTDVITLRYRPLPGSPPGGEAEILVNAQRARREGLRRPGGPPAEFALYLAHGIDHLAGNDDATPPERRAMRSRERAWLAALAPLLPRLLLPPPPAP
jgi:ssRNA-specific RNase YbeY (16S rRNA maturation enzyme)